MRAVGVWSTRSTSAPVSPTRASLRLSTTSRLSLLSPSRSSMSMAIRRFFSAGMSGVATSTCTSVTSSAASTCSVKWAGVSMTT